MGKCSTNRSSISKASIQTAPTVTTTTSQTAPTVISTTNVVYMLARHAPTVIVDTDSKIAGEVDEEEDEKEEISSGGRQKQ